MNTKLIPVPVNIKLIGEPVIVQTFPKNGAGDLIIKKMDKRVGILEAYGMGPGIFWMKLRGMKEETFSLKQNHIEFFMEEKLFFVLSGRDN